MSRFLKSSRELLELRSITLAALLIALYVATNTLSVYLGPVKITFSYLAFALLGLFLGPVTGALACGAADVLAYIVRPAGAYHPGFTLTAVLTGFVFGLFLYREKLSVLRVAIPRVIINLFLNVCLNTFWLTTILGKGYFVMLPDRLWKNLVLLPVEVFLIYTVAKIAHEYMRRVKTG